MTFPFLPQEMNHLVSWYSKYQEACTLFDEKFASSLLSSNESISGRPSSALSQRPSSALSQRLLLNDSCASSTSFLTIPGTPFNGGPVIILPPVSHSSQTDVLSGGSFIILPPSSDLNMPLSTNIAPTIAPAIAPAISPAIAPCRHTDVTLERREHLQ